MQAPPKKCRVYDPQRRAVWRHPEYLFNWKMYFNFGDRACNTKHDAVELEFSFMELTLNSMSNYFRDMDFYSSKNISLVGPKQGI